MVGAYREQLHDADGPTAEKPAPRSRVWNISKAQWREAVKQRGEDKREDVKLALWPPACVEAIKRIVDISGHGSGESRDRDPELRPAVFKFIGNPMQSGFWPKTCLTHGRVVLA